MIRMLSLGVAVAVGLMIVPALSIVAQDADTCQKEKCAAAAKAKCGNCQAIEFELVGVDLPTAEKKSKKREISIQVSCNCDVPFLSKLPMLNHVFGTVAAEECEAIEIRETDDESSCSSCTRDCSCRCECGCNCCGKQQAESKVDFTFAPDHPRADSNGICEVIVYGRPADQPSCDSCGDGCTCFSECDRSSCSKQEKNEKQCVCESGIPFYSNMPYVNRLFKNVGVCDGNCQQACQEASCSVTCEEEACCPAGKCPAFSSVEAACPACPQGAWVQMASHHEPAVNEGPTRDQFYEALMEAHAENARLEARLEAMEHHIEMMEEMAELRAENAALQARLQMMEEQKATTATWHVHPGNAHGNITVSGLPHPPHARASSAGATLTPSKAGIKVKVPAARAAIFAHELPEPTEVQRMAEHVRILKKIKQQQGKCSGKESSCTKDGSK